MRFLFVLFCLCSFQAFASSQVVIRTQTTASVTITSTKILDANADRAYLFIQNQGTQNIIIKFNSVQSATEGILIVGGGSYEPVDIPLGAVYAISASGTQSVIFVEGF